MPTPTAAPELAFPRGWTGKVGRSAADALGKVGCSRAREGRLLTRSGTLAWLVPPRSRQGFERRAGSESVGRARGRPVLRRGPRWPSVSASAQRCPTSRAGRSGLYSIALYPIW